MKLYGFHSDLAFKTREVLNPKSQSAEKDRPETPRADWRAIDNRPMNATGHDTERPVLYDVGVAHRGKFITFEGLDGCGKSTQLEKLAAALRAQGLAVVETREPGGTPTGEKIRQLLLDTSTSALAPLAELALMFASRAQHIKEVIQPALARRPHRALRPLHRFQRSLSGRRTKAGQRAGARAASHLVRRSKARTHNSDGLRRRRSAWSAPAAATRRARIALTESDENRFEQESRAFFGRVPQHYLAIADPRHAARRGGRRPRHAGRNAQEIMEIVGRKLKLPARSA